MENSSDDEYYESDYDATYDGLTQNETEYAKKHIDNLNDGLHESDNELYDGLTPNETAYAKKHIDKLNDEITRDIIDGENSYYDRVYRVNNEPFNSRSLTEHRDQRDRRQVKGLKNDITTKSNLTRLDTKLDVLIQMVQMNNKGFVEENDDKKDFYTLKAYLKKNEASLLSKKRFFKQNGDTTSYKELKSVLKIIE